MCSSSREIQENGLEQVLYMPKRWQRFTRNIWWIQMNKSRSEFRKCGSAEEVNFSIINEGTWIENMLKTHNPVYHHSCNSKYKNMFLKKRQDRGNNWTKILQVMTGLFLPLKVDWQLISALEFVCFVKKHTIESISVLQGR